MNQLYYDDNFYGLLQPHRVLKSNGLLYLYYDPTATSFIYGEQA
jgi:hypothetical protein